MPISPNPFGIKASTSPPSTALIIRPRPPNSEVPPMTAAPTANNSVSLAPVFESTEFTRDARKMPPTAATSAVHTNADSSTRVTLMPARLAASRLPPTAYRNRPYRRRSSTKLSTTTSTAIAGMTIGIPVIGSGAVAKARFWFSSAVSVPTRSTAPPIRIHTSDTGIAP